MDRRKPESEATQRISKNAGRLLIAIVVVLAIVAVYANVQKLRRDRIETVTFVPASPAPSPAAKSP